jgi:SAM-dependent methyltransferase
MRTYSILRAREDAEIAKLNLKGRVIDLGGHKGSSYFKLIRTEKPVEVVNLDAEQPGTHKTPSGADYIFDLEVPFPLDTEMFDAVLCFNVLEHVYNFQNLVRESFRILRKEGEIHISVPFFFNIHGSPDDYFRYTQSALVRILGDVGFSDIRVIELGDGPCSAMFQNFGGSIPTLFLKLCFKNFAVGIDVVLSKISKRYASIKRRVPLGYFVSARK